MAVLKIYTDGACSGNQNEKNTGGGAPFSNTGNIKKKLFGGESDTTNNRMEMTALLKAFNAIKKEGQIIEFFSDSSLSHGLFQKKMVFVTG
jgi:ribonuclease HI